MKKSDLGDIQVAMLDDDPLYREITQALLQSHSDIHLFTVGSYNDLVPLLWKEKIDCILLDYDLGDDNGLNVIQKLGDEFSETPPVVMLTGDGRERTVIKALRMGVSDYLPKAGLTVEDITSTIRKAVRKRQKESQRTADHARLLAASGSDSLTGILNQETLNGRLEQLSSMSFSARLSYALILVEIKDFSGLTGKFGFKVSDKFVAAFARQLNSLVRTNDVLGRYADCEFLIIANVMADENLLDRLCHRIAQHMLLKIELDAGSLTVSARVGASLCHALPVNGVLTPSSLLAPSRRALESTKARDDPYHIELAPSGPVASGDGTANTMPAGDVTRFVDRRREPRLRVYKKGQIILAHLNAVIDCVVRDMSKGGARLRVATNFAVPETFDLIIVGEHERRKVKLCWQKAGDFGVEYIV